MTLTDFHVQRRKHSEPGERPALISMAPVSVQQTAGRDHRLIAVKLLHTIIWACFAACVLALPVAAFNRHFGWVLILTAIILGECIVLAANQRRCPLTDWASQLTDDRADNFDIYLPNWLARHNKAIFGTLFVVNEVIVLWRWLSRP